MRSNAQMRQEPVTGQIARIAPQHARENRNDAGDGRLCASVGFLARHHFPRRLLAQATCLAALNGTSAASELIAHGQITEDAYYRTLADHHGIAFLDPADLIEVLDDDRGRVSRAVAWCRIRGGGVALCVAPATGLAGTARFAAQLGKLPSPRITTPSALRAAVVRKNRHELAGLASERLATDSAQNSAKFGAGAWHGLAVGALVASFVIGLLFNPGTTFLATHILLSVFFLSCVVLRAAATLSYRRKPYRALEQFPNSARPVYSVIVALYQEAPVVPDLIRALRQLRWPATKLEFKIVCEEGDKETLAALAAQRLDARFEIIETPPVGPQTKPKALNFALPFCRGAYVTLFDAEDRPHPDQIEEAWQVFRASDNRLGALQAPLLIANPRRNLLGTMFHLEYATLFAGILQWLADRNLPVPLGGTSTHFRRSAIEDCGGWDPYNVTEDADLGFRMWHAGYHVGLLGRPTLEDAPDTIPVWIRQRTRWIKGWLQTWVVRTRRMRRLYGGGRLAGVGVMHTLLAGTVISTLFYPLTIIAVVMVAVMASLNVPLPPSYVWLAALGWTNIGASLAIHAALCLQTVNPQLRSLTLRTLPAAPLYWLLASVAAWRAVYQFVKEPFLWEKTPHKAHDPDGEFHHL